MESSTELIHQTIVPIALKMSSDWGIQFGLTVTDPDGWDRQNFDASWAELISEEEFKRRLSKSTSITFPKNQTVESSFSTISAAIHYPDCWDVVTYPTLEFALDELYDTFKCSECSRPNIVQPARILPEASVRHAYENIMHNYEGFQGYPNFKIVWNALCAPKAQSSQPTVSSSIEVVVGQLMEQHASNKNNPDAKKSIMDAIKILASLPLTTSIPGKS